ncbi:MAG: cell division FtsZ family protein [Verrucomicrobia subdivision 3 bacterium]|nr:cell division FtsZ family protein [Limisphaerales bacterium]
MDFIHQTPTSERFTKISVLGVGGAGCNAVTHLAREPLAGVTLAVLNTDAAALARLSIEPRIVLGKQATRGLSAGGDPERGRAAAEEDASSIQALCDGADIVFVVAGLGGGTGTGAAPVAARIARESRALVFGIALMPFEFEGARRQRQAALGLQELKAVADGVIWLPNQKLLKLVDDKTPIVEALDHMNSYVARTIVAIWGLLTRPGIVQVDFAALRAVTQGRHAESSIAIAEASGDDRAREAAEKLVAHPMLEGGALLTEANQVLVSILAGPAFSMGEVHHLMERINRVCDGAHITVGAAVDARLGDQLTVTLIASRGGADSSAAALLAADAASEGLNPFRPAKTKPDQAETPRLRKQTARLRQTQLPLDIISRGRFEKSEPTIHHGQDLDVPTYIRRGVALN